jgi:hypothetical protein
MYVNGKLLFKGDDYKPSDLYDWDALETTVDLLGFLAIGKGGTDKDYFKNYTQAQLDWANDIGDIITVREKLNLLISDVLDTDEIEYYKDAIKAFKHKIF